MEKTEVKLKQIKKGTKGITLIALVVTIIVLLILAGISISMLTGDNGILKRAQEAKEETEKASKREQADIDMILDYIDENTKGEYVKEKGVNSPKLVTGMTKIMFTEPSTESKGKVIELGEAEFDNENWYDYKKKNWANVMTEDGSMWVWIPRFAYKIKSYDADSKVGTMDVKFLIGTTNQYYDEDGTVKTAKRVTSENDTADTKNEYYVHPAFTDESDKKINYANGGWDKELSGIWVAKFEAGYAGGNNSAKVKESSQKYTQENTYVYEPERETKGSDQARNWLDGIYGSKETKIKYPTFQGITYSMNYITHNDAFNIAKALNEDGNIYGFNANTTDSHLMKNSEWGAVTYLAQSQYGLNETNIAKNNITLNSGGAKREVTTGKNGVDSVWAVTGLTTGKADSSSILLTAEDIRNLNSTTGNTPVNKVYGWNQQSGEAASSTGTIYGVYDLSGGLAEETAAYVANNNVELEKYGSSLLYNGSKTDAISTKYTTAYTSGEKDENEPDNASKNNYNNAVNSRKFGDAIHETSTSGSGWSWFNCWSYFPCSYVPFFDRGGYWNDLYGLFSFHRMGGSSNNQFRFSCCASCRIVLLSIKAF